MKSASLARILVITWVALVAARSGARAAEPAIPEEQQVRNLAAFARVYGYVRFFHPSDAASAVDWDKVGIVGVEAVRSAPDTAALRSALLDVFAPIAPTLRLTLATESNPAAATGNIASPAAPQIFWQRLGLALTTPPGPYRQRRVITGEKRGEHAPLFTPATPPPAVNQVLAPGLTLELPLALPLTAGNATGELDAPAFTTLQARLNALDLKPLTATDWRVRIADVVTVWSVFQHFHPYIGQLGIDWPATLEPSLRQALADRTVEDFRRTLLALVALTHDGHGSVTSPPIPLGELPAHLGLIENDVVVTGVADGSPLRKGDIIEQLDGGRALDVLRDGERHAPGSAQLSEFRALNAFGEAAAGTTAHLQIRRDSATLPLDVARTPERMRRYFFNSIPEFTFPNSGEVRPGIWYLNLISLTPAELESRLSQLAAARGVILDWRWDGRDAPTSGKRLSVHEDVIAHLIDETIQASPMLVPKIAQPDRIGWAYDEHTWPVKPKSPRFKGRIVFIDEPSVVSYGETCMAMVADYHLAKLVGAPTAGTNGNVSFLPLPGGFRVMWTAMDVRKHDHSSFYGTGFVPDYPVTRTLAAVKEGRDEYLEKAIEVIQQGS